MTDVSRSKMRMERQNSARVEGFVAAQRGLQQCERHRGGCNSARRHRGVCSSARGIEEVATVQEGTEVFAVEQRRGTTGSTG